MLCCLCYACCCCCRTYSSVHTKEHTRPVRVRGPEPRGGHLTRARRSDAAADRQPTHRPHEGAWARRGLDTASDGANRDLSHTDPTAAVPSPSPSPHSLPPVLHGVEVSSATTAPSVALLCGWSTGGASDLLEAELCIAASQHEHHKCYSAAANAAHCLTRQDSCQSICCYSATTLHVNLLSF